MNVIELNASTAGSHRRKSEVLDVLVIGAGFSGVCAAIKLLEKGITNFRLFEKSGGIGGTWWENVYPGAACDIPSHLYCYSFEPNPNWSKLYPAQAEIQAYIEHCADKYGIRPYMEFGAQIRALVFEDNTGLWRAEFADGRRVHARHVVNASGGLHKPSIPDFEGRAGFRGAQMHTAKWDRAYDFAGKRVAVIGSAASAVQLVPELAKVAKHLTVFQRTPNYIVPRLDRPYTEARKRLFARNPWLMRLYRWLIFTRLDVYVFPIISNAKIRARRGEQVKQYIRSQIADPAMQKALEPDYELGCKRILLSDDFYQALQRDNVELVTRAAARIAPEGVVAVDGRLHEADVIVYATGFDLPGHQQSIPITGPGGRTLAQAWADHAEAYQGASVAGFPNYYLVTGPNTGVGTTSVVFMAEQSLRWILECIETAGNDGLLSVKPEAQQRYNEALHAALATRVWATGCKSWYKRADGRIETLYPHNARSFAKQMRQVRLADFELRRKRPAVAAVSSLAAER